MKFKQYTKQLAHHACIFGIIFNYELMKMKKKLYSKQTTSLGSILQMSIDFFLLFFGGGCRLLFAIH